MQFVGRGASYCYISLIFLLNKCETSEVIGNVGDFYHYGPFINPQAFAFYIIDEMRVSGFGMAENNWVDLNIEKVWARRCKHRKRKPHPLVANVRWHNPVVLQQALAARGKQRGWSFLPWGQGLGTEMFLDGRNVTLEDFWDEIFISLLSPFLPPT